MALVSKPKLEGLGLDGQFPFTARGTKHHHRRSRKNSSPSMVPNQHSCLTKQPYDDFLHIYMLLLFLLLMARTTWFFKPFFFIYHFQDL